jgi:hypothetical protein
VIKICGVPMSQSVEMYLKQSRIVDFVGDFCSLYHEDSSGRP